MSAAAPTLPVAATHRPEIDGLRALAVLPVILFHAGFGLFSGGYVGVDVFFVISGYLITGIILKERLAGRFSLLRFYERRARRILPALFLVVLCCLPLAWRWMLPGELAAFGRSLVAVALFVSNLLFWRTTGYFDLAAEEKPLLHTWSLGVEEQFYVAFPLLVAVAWRLGLRGLGLLLAGLAAASFLFSEWLIPRDAAAAFFVAPTRAWELLAGALLALRSVSAPWRQPLGRATREAGAAAGLALILAPVFLFDANTPFPGRYALVPVAGTLLVLAFATPQTWAGRLLTLRAMLWVGAISYSAYLWHQPLFAYARLMAGQPPAPVVFAALAVLSLALAHLSWRFVENPWRDASRRSRKAVFAWAAAGSLALVGVGLWWVQAQGLASRWSPGVRHLVAPEGSRITGCPAINAWLQVCPLGAPGVAPTLALLGDSHAYAITPALGEALAASGRAGVLVHTGCHPIPGLFDSREPLTPQRVAHCAKADELLRQYVAAPGITELIVAIRWTARLYPMGGEIDAPAFDNHEGGVEGDYPYRRNLIVAANGQGSDAAAPKAHALQAYLQGLAALKPTVVLYPVPEVGWMPPRLNLAAVALGRDPPQQISTSWPRMQQRNAVAHRLLDAATAPNLRRVRPEQRFCNTVIAQRCVVQAAGLLYYADDDHLSLPGARLVVGDLLAVLATR